MDCNRKLVEINRGNSFNPTYFVNNNGTAIDITGWTFWYTVRTKPAPETTLNDSDAVMHKEVGPIVDGADGLVSFFFSDTETMQEIRKYIADVKYKKVDGITVKSSEVFDFKINENSGQSS